jgi:hypothetical protein
MVTTMKIRTIMALSHVWISEKGCSFLVILSQIIQYKHKIYHFHGFSKLFSQQAYLLFFVQLQLKFWSLLNPSFPADDETVASVKKERE